MRVVTNLQMKLGEIDISQVKIDLKARDEIPKLLIGFQHIYTNLKIRGEVFKALEKLIPDNINKNNGRPGMELWRILVLGSLRLNNDWDYDKLIDISNNHKTIRLMLGIGEYDDFTFNIDTLKQNISLFTYEVLGAINEIVVKHAQSEVEKKKETPITAHCDSFVVKTNVHYPTDINLLYDAMRKTIGLISSLCLDNGIDGWRQGSKLIHSIKNKLYHIQNGNRRGGKDTEKKEKEKLKVYGDYITYSQKILERAKADITRLKFLKLTKSQQKTLNLLIMYSEDAVRQIDQIRRRVLQGEAIPHSEKVFSIFQRHTEWVVKGKAGVPQELGVKVCVIKDQYGLIMNHTVMENTQDVDIAVPFTIETKNKYPNLVGCGYDKGFYSLANYAKLTEVLEKVIMPKKGKRNAIENERELSSDFIKERKGRSAVESSIAALVNHGLDLCPDKEILGFKRYVGLAVLSRNIQILGNAIQCRELRSLQRMERKEDIRKKVA